MLPEQRIQIIREKLGNKKRMKVKKLEELLQVSRATIYRDLSSLCQEGFLMVSRGEAVLLYTPPDPKHQEKSPDFASVRNLSQLTSIAHAAVLLIEKADSIFLGEGLLCFLLARQITASPDLKNITIVTNNFPAALTLSSYTKYVYMTGGEVLQNTENYYTGGPKFAGNLSSIYVNKAFAAVDGVDLRAGYTVQSLSQLNILSHLPEFSANTIILAPSSRFGCRSIHQLAPLEFGRILITDSGIDRSSSDVFSKRERPRLLTAGAGL